MGERIIKVSTLRDSGKGISKQGEQVQTEWGKLKSSSEGRGDIFGDDDVGGLIGMSYQAVFGLADEAFTTAADDFNAFGEALTKAGDRHAETERNHAAILKRLGSAFDGVQAPGR
jgi:hypothetical protein